MWLLSKLLFNTVGKIFDIIDKRIDSESKRDELRAEVIKTHMLTRSDWLRAGGFVTLLLFAVPTAIHYASVITYSIFWCADCAYPKDWTIAALPGQMQEWEGYIILASIGGLSLLGTNFFRK